jgi:hypothetical protein
MPRRGGAAIGAAGGRVLYANGRATDLPQPVPFVHNSEGHRGTGVCRKSYEVRRGCQVSRAMVSFCSTQWRY